jgi:hypothetical protein
LHIDACFSPFKAIGELGMHGLKPTGPGAGRVLTMRAAQENVCNMKEFQSNTVFVRTAQFAVLNSTTYNSLAHYYGRADTIYHIGQAFGTSMIQLLARRKLM